MNRHQLAADLERDEGRRAHAYTDSEGYLTIGIGHLIDRRKGGELPDHIIDELLQHDITAVVRALNDALPWWRRLSEARRRALANMAFNLGIGGLLGFRRMLAALQASDYERAAAEALDSKWARQVGDRAERIAALIRAG